MKYPRLVKLRQQLKAELVAEFGLISFAVEHASLIEQRLQSILMAGLDEKDDKDVKPYGEKI